MEERRKPSPRISETIRERYPGSAGTPFLDLAKEGCAELLALLALELLDGEASAWWPYLRTLPAEEFAAPPSLWGEVFGEEGAAAAAALQGTQLAPLLARDAHVLRGLLHPEGRAALQDFAPAGAGPEDVADALRRALGLISSRFVGGIGLVPFLDLANGVCKGRHNATFERANLAQSAQAAAEPCIAIVASGPIPKGQEILLSYGAYSAADFLYRYGWVEGGPDLDAAAEAPSERAGLAAAEVWAALRGGQRAVLEKHGLGLPELEAEEPFSVPLAEAAQGALPGPLKQAALIACCEDEAALQELAQTGRTSGGKGTTVEQVAQRVAEWCAAHVRRLCAEVPAATSGSVQGRLALRLRRGERERLLKWILGLQNKYKLPKELWMGAMKWHVASCKGLPLPAAEE